MRALRPLVGITLAGATAVVLGACGSSGSSVPKAVPAGGATTSAPARASTPDLAHPCNHLSRPDVAAILGVDVREPVEEQLGTVSACKVQEPEGSSDLVSVVAGYLRGSSPQSVFDTDRQTSNVKNPVPGLGDAAFCTDVEQRDGSFSGHHQMLHLVTIKGDVVVQVVMDTPKATCEQATDIARRLLTA